MSVSGIQGQPLEVTVVGCTKLKDTEWISRQDPYVTLEYSSTKYRTSTCTDGGKNPTFQEKFVFTLIEGLRELNVVVWNSNTITHDDHIGSGKIQLSKVLSQGYDDSSWPLQDKRGRHSGEVRLILHYANAKNNKPQKPAKSYAPSAPPYESAANPQSPRHHPMTSYPGMSYPAPPYPSYPPVPGMTYPPPPTYPPTYPPPPYPPQSFYPPPPHGSYPPPPY